MIPSEPHPSKPGPYDFYQNVLMPTHGLFRAMHQEGMVIDHSRREELDKEFQLRIDNLEQEMWGLEDVHTEFNPRSPQQVAAIFFDKLRLRPVKGRGTDVDVLEALQDSHPIIRMMMRHRSMSKTHGTYIKAIAKHIAVDGRLHSEFQPQGSVSRTSSRNPNVQNIPRKGDLDDPDSAIIRNLFTAPPGFVVGHIDFDQHEFKMTAVYSQDEWLTNVFNGPNPDMHSEVAVEYYGPDYTYEERIKAKVFNFGILYGITAFTLAKKIGGTQSEAEERLQQFFDRMPDVRAWIDAVKQSVMEGNDLESLTGRHRRFGLLTRNNIDDVMKQAINFFPQSTGSDTALMGVNRSWQKVSSEVYKPVAFIHDAQVAYIKEDVAIEVLSEIAQHMVQGATDLVPSDVPFTVSAEIGPSWGEVEKVELHAA